VVKDITVEVKGYAKINLALHVTGVREDRYHVLDSIVIFTDIYDSLFIKKTRKIV
jgi:4-diphosphocytidyl-2-C-methyl-D-erythritol kinase